MSSEGEQMRIIDYDDFFKFLRELKENQLNEIYKKMSGSKEQQNRLIHEMKNKIDNVFDGYRSICTSKKYDLDIDTTEEIKKTRKKRRKYTY